MKPQGDRAALDELFATEMCNLEPFDCWGPVGNLLVTYEIPQSRVKK